jgi:hypothetical protein
MGRSRPRDPFPLPPNHADGNFHGSRIHSDRPDRFLGPDGFCDHGGLFVATMLTLIVLPALYVAWFRVKEPVRERAAA